MTAPVPIVHDFWARRIAASGVVIGSKTTLVEVCEDEVDEKQRKYCQSV
jgi:hypothetical protein